MLSYQAALGLFCIFVGVVIILVPPRSRRNPRSLSVSRAASRLPPQVQRLVPVLMGLALIGLGIALLAQGSR